MNIIEAMKAVKEGRMIARRIWENDDHVEQNDEDLFPTLIHSKSMSGFSCKEFTPIIGDYFAEDWYMEE